MLIILSALRPFPDQLQILTGGRISATAFLFAFHTSCSVITAEKGKPAQKGQDLVTT